MYDPEDKKEKMPSLVRVVPVFDDEKLKKDQWRWAIENFTQVQKAHGIHVHKGVWELVDARIGIKMLDPYKTWLRELLNEKKAQGKFKWVKIASEEEWEMEDK